MRCSNFMSFKYYCPLKKSFATCLINLSVHFIPKIWQSVIFKNLTQKKTEGCLQGSIESETEEGWNICSIELNQQFLLLHCWNSVSKGQCLERSFCGRHSTNTHSFPKELMIKLENNVPWPQWGVLAATHSSHFWNFDNWWQDVGPWNEKKWKQTRLLLKNKKYC